MARTLSTASLGRRDGPGHQARWAIGHLGLGRRWSRLSRFDRWAVALLVALPVLIEVPPSLMGRPLLNGDNLTQNYPLRVLSGELLRHGRLPLWDPYIWSGTPLLAGWNAGALYPGTWLFAILPGIAAWTINLVAVSLVCGIGMHVFLRRLGMSPPASALGALTFTYTGYMLGQDNHYGLLAGMSFAPWMLLAAHELAKPLEPRMARRWIALLGACGGLAVLAGDPRSVSNLAIIVGLYFLAALWRARRGGLQRNVRTTVSMAVASLLAIGLSTAQWLPGLSFLHESQRASDSYVHFANGSLSWHDLWLLFVPLLVGGNGNFGIPNYAGSYNLPELSYAVGIVPLVAAFALARRALVQRSGARPLGVWYVMILVGVILSAGASTPLGHLLASIPLYGGQRLQNRNSVLVDLGLAVLLATFVDVLVSGGHTRDPGNDRAPVGAPQLTRSEILAGLVPVGIVGALILAAYVRGRFVQRLMGAARYLPHLASSLTPYFAATLVISAGAGVLLLVAPRLDPRARLRVVSIIVAADLLLALADANYGLPEPATLARSNATTLALAKLLGPQGRFAVFNPAQSLPDRYRTVIHEIGTYDLPILHHIDSVQGYGSVVADRYEHATGSHEVENLQPAALLKSNLDVLNLKDLVTLPEYLVAAIPGNRPIPVATGTPVVPGASRLASELNAIAPLKPLRPLPPTLLEPGRSSIWMLPGPFALDSVTVVVLGHEGTVAKSVTVGILNSANQVVHDRVVPVVGSTATVALNGLVAYGLELGAPLHTPAVVGALAVSTVKATTVNSGPLTHRLVLNQVLQGVLEPPRWRYRTEIGGLPVFANTLTRGATWLEPAGSPTPLAALISSARATTPVVEAWQNPVTYVSTPRAGVLVRSVAFEPGWRALVTPAGGGPTATVKVRQLGLVQAISLPRGRFKVTWVYTSKRAIVGLLVSVLSTIALMILLFLPRRRRRPRTAGQAGPAAGPEPHKDLEPEELVVAAGESDSADERFPLAHPSAPG